MKTKSILALLLTCALAGPLFGQQKIYDWVHASDEALRLDPSFFQATRIYHPGLQGLHIRFDLRAGQPVTIAMAELADWNDKVQHPEAVDNMRYWCVREHEVSLTYECDLPPSQDPMVLIVHDERMMSHAVLSGIGAAFGGRAVAQQFIAPNNVQIAYYGWACIENCYPPEFRAVRLVKEKYQLTPILKVYSALTPEYDGEQLYIKMKSPVPMMVAVLPSSIANKLYDKPEALEAAVANGACQQRGVQSVNIGCKFSAHDGPQSLVVVPEQGTSIPVHKKAQIELIASKCVANCLSGTK